MASLFNTKISETYSGLIKTLDTTAVTTATLKLLSDGNGTSLGLSVNNQGDFKVNAILEWGSLKDTGTGITITNFVDSTATLASNKNDTTIPTSKAVSDYVDAQVGASDLDFSGDSGTGAVILSSETFAVTGTANQIETTASGTGLSLSLPSTVQRDLQGNVTGNLTGDVTGNVTGNVTGDLTGDSAGTHTGAVVGNVTGNVTGDLTGIVTATSSLADGVTATSQAVADDSTKVATTAFVQDVVGTIPAGLVFQGTWNASTNTPTLASGTGTTGHFYIVSVAGSTDLDGITDWKVGDWAVFVEQGASDQWEKVDNSSVLDGNGTGGKISKWAGSGNSVTLTDSIITESGSNIGIGMTPTKLLDIQATDNLALRYYNSTSFKAGIEVATTDGDMIGSSVINDLAIRSQSNMLFATGGNTERMRIDSAGNVGIGDVNPERKLHVNSGAENANTIFESTDTAVTVRFKDTTGEAEIESRNDFRFSNNAGADQRMVIGSDGAIKFNNYGAGTLVSDASGNITSISGGGEGGPYLPLAGGTLTGNITAVKGIFESSNNQISIIDSDDSQDFRVQVNSGIFSVRDHTNSQTIFKIDANAGSSALHLQSSGATFAGSITTNLSAEGTYFTGGSGGVRQLSITSGTNSSAHALHTFNIASSNGKYKFDIDGNEEFSIDSGGATFAGSIGVGGNAASNGYMIDVTPSGGNIIRSTRGTSVFGSYQSNNSDVYLGTISNNTFKIITNDTVAVTLDNSQNATFAGDIIVPNGKISTIGGNNLTISGSVAEHAGLSFATNSVLPATVSATNNNVVDLGQNGNSFKNLYLGSEIISGGGATFAGQVGIGTASPAHKLDVQVSGNVARFGDGTRFFRIYTDSDEVSLLADGSVPMKFYTSGSEKMRIDSSGNVGIGTGATVDANLHVVGTDIKLQGVGIAGDLTFAYNAGNNSTTVADVNYANINATVTSGSTGSESGKLSFQTRNAGTVADRMVIDSAGNVGIGTTAPASKLHIYQNSTDTNTGAGITIEQDGTGDAVVQYLLTGDRRWVVGVDNSDSNRFKFASSADVGTDTVLTINTSEAGGRVGIGTSTPDTTLEVASSTPTLRLTNTTDPLGNGTVGNFEFFTNDSSTGASRVVSSIVCDNQAGSAVPEGQLVFNTAVGGGSGAAVAERMRINSSGNVGIGVSAPVSTLQTVAASAEQKTASLTDSGSRTGLLTLSGLSNQVGGAGGGIVFAGNSTTSYAAIKGLLQSGGGNTTGNIAFATRGSSTDSALTERMRITSAGDFIFNTSSASLQTYPTQGSNQIHAGGSTYFSIGHITGSSSGNLYMGFGYNGTGIGSITQNGTTGISFNTSSDYRLKENVVEMTGALDRVAQLKPSRFNFIADSDTTVDGFLAHEVQEVVPEAITGTKDAMKDEEYEVTPAVYDGDELVTEAVMGTRSVEDYQGIDQSKLVPLLVGAIQELRAEIELLKNK